MILITEFMDQAAVDRLAAAHEVTYDPGLAGRQEEIPAMLSGRCALIVRNRTQVTPALLEAGPDLLCVGRLGVGLDNIDMAACAAQGVAVYPAIGVNALSVSEYVLCTAMMLLRGAYRVNERMIAGDWPRQACSGRELSGKLLGLVGFGGIARDTAGRARALGMEVAAYDPLLPEDDAAWALAGRLGLEDLAGSADVLSLHVPLTEATRHMVNSTLIARMPKGAILINAARGGVVNETDLVDALRSGHLGGAALDVFETEPLTVQAAARFAEAPNLILTPHIAGVTLESNARVSDLIAERILSHLATAG